MLLINVGDLWNMEEPQGSPEKQSAENMRRGLPERRGAQTARTTYLKCLRASQIRFMDLKPPLGPANSLKSSTSSESLLKAASAFLTMSDAAGGLTSSTTSLRSPASATGIPTSPARSTLACLPRKPLILMEGTPSTAASIVMPIPAPYTMRSAALMREGRSTKPSSTSTLPDFTKLLT
uniref:Uncharacterized protein n=1 Tax=Methanothermobacter thermautotrophicus TaxID=145262 RepID=Q50499_METTF|nr:unknown [Methanothermobacter thermautotrophicus]